jgi:hypothetical protein
MLQRDLAAPGQKRAIRDLLQSIFVAELIKPSKRFWLASAWVSDIGIMDNSARQFSALCPDWPSRMMRLSETLQAIVSRGGSVVCVLRDEIHNYQFMDKIKIIKELFPDQVRLIVGPDFHEKGILGEDYLLSGSMNFTFKGIEVNDEHLYYRCDLGSVHERRIVLEEKWRDHL